MSVWAIGMAVAVNASSAADADSGTIVSVFSPSDERAAIAAIRRDLAAAVVTLWLLPANVECCSLERDALLWFHHLG